MFENINKFNRIFIIFTGNSINEITDDCWKKLNNEATISTNHSFKVFKFGNPTYLFFADKDVLYGYWKWYKDKKIKPIVYCRDKSVYNKVDARYPELVPKDWIDNHIDEFWNEKNLVTPRSFNITPIWLFGELIKAEYKGKVYLLGADFYIEDDMYHFQNYDIDYYKKRKLEKKLNDYKKYFESPIFDGKLDFYNCNTKSTLEKFPKVELRDILNE